MDLARLTPAERLAAEQAVLTLTLRAEPGRTRSLDRPPAVGRAPLHDATTASVSRPRWPIATTLSGSHPVIRRPRN